MPSTSKKEVAVTTQCIDCGCNRYFSKYEVARGRHNTTRCRLCATKEYYKNKPKRTKEQKAAYMREYYQRRKAELDTYTAEWRERKRVQLIQQLGGKCGKCGESDPIVLDFDHINDDGAEHRRATRKRNVVFLVADPERQFQLLCKNCNWRKEYARRKNAEQNSKAA